MRWLATVGWAVVVLATGCMAVGGRAGADAGSDVISAMDAVNDVGTAMDAGDVVVTVDAGADVAVPPDTGTHIPDAGFGEDAGVDVGHIDDAGLTPPDRGPSDDSFFVLQQDVTPTAVDAPVVGPPDAPTPDHPLADTMTGQPCTRDSQCGSDDGASCLTTWPGGYCTVIDCTSNSDCDSDALCVVVDRSGDSACLKACTATPQCRTGYVCNSVNATSTQGICYPSS